uniref:RING-type domain-containing protein n=1 Tax=Panagrolaimus sp. JU765 TaxID=591449 RepID=A0AC34QEZ3_9BILA
MKRLQKEYPNILDGIDLKEDADSFVYEPVQEAEQFDCGICLSSYSISKRVSCGNSEESNCHSFCINCVREQANAATGEMPLAEGAVGLKCMDTDCDKPIYYGLIRNLLPSAIRKRMDDRIQEENLAVSGLQLERCKNCNFAAEMNVDKTVNKVFDCLGCGKQWCRLCEKEWNDEHFG